MSQVTKVLAENPGHEIDEKDQVMIGAVIRSLSVGLFHMQMTGMIRFPAGDLTMGEIESGLDGAAAAFVQKLIESKPR